MARYELKLPKMGESVAEATITNWLKGIRRKPVNQRLKLICFTEERPATPFRINSLRVGFTEFFRLKTLLVQRRAHNSEVVDIFEKAGVSA